jgi:hypothetical protein
VSVGLGLNISSCCASCDAAQKVKCSNIVTADTTTISYESCWIAGSLLDVVKWRGHSWFPGGLARNETSERTLWRRVKTGPSSLLSYNFSSVDTCPVIVSSLVSWYGQQILEVLRLAVCVLVLLRSSGESSRDRLVISVGEIVIEETASALASNYHYSSIVK